MNRKIFAWALYDFANTPLTVAMGGLFLAQWVILDQKIDDLWYGATFTAATILLLVTSPFLGAWSDAIGKRMPFMKWTTAILVVVGILIDLVATSSMERIPRVVVVLALFFIFQYTYQISLIFYNALLKVIAKPAKRGWVSGIGEAFGEFGWLASPLILLPFGVGMVTLLGQMGRAQVFLPAAAVLLLFGLPMFWWLREPEPKRQKKVNIGAVYKATIEGLRLLLKHDRNVAVFLVAFMLVSDALLTANLYFAIYLDQIFKMTDVQKGLGLVVMEAIAVISSLVFGRLSDWVSNKTLVIVAALNLTFVYIVMSMVSSITWAYILMAFAGLGFGGFYTTSRALVFKVSPPDKLGEYFGFFSTFQKFASIIGPMTWGIVTWVLRDYGLVRYRAGVFALACFMFVGTIIMFKVKEKRVVVQSSYPGK